VLSGIAFTSLLVIALTAEAVIPPPDGGYPNFTTAEGTKALQSLTTGSANTAVGWLSLFSTATGSFNTATGAGALLFNAVDENTAFGAAALLFNTTGINNTAHWSGRPFKQHRRPAQHGHRLFCAPVQHNR
jgi:hypothetical protein